MKLKTIFFKRAGKPVKSGYFLNCTRKSHRHTVTYTRCCIDTIDSPDDEHEIARNI